MSELRSGTLDTDDFDNLQSFVMFALKLMEQKGPVAWNAAKEGAIADYTAALIYEVAQPGERSAGRASSLIEAARAVGKLRAPHDMDEDLQEAYKSALAAARITIRGIKP